jgi:tellurite resistance-related uncharacterized protein
VFEIGVLYYLSTSGPKWAKISDQNLYEKYREELGIAQSLAVLEGKIKFGWRWDTSGDNDNAG